MDYLHKFNYHTWETNLSLEKKPRTPTNESSGSDKMTMKKQINLEL